MTATQFSKLLSKLHACTEASEWAHGKTLKTVWETCERADWLLWLAGRMVGEPGWPDRKQIALVLCDCAETSLKYVPAGEDRPRKCIETVRAWANGRATLEEVDAAWSAARSAAWSAARSAAESAAESAAWSAAWSAAESAAWSAAWSAAESAAWSAARSAAESAAFTKANKELADIVRARLTIPTGKARG